MNHLRELVKNNIFTVEFIKKDGTPRVMNCSFNIGNRIKKDIFIKIKKTQEHISSLNKGIMPTDILQTLSTNESIKSQGCISALESFAVRKNTPKTWTQVLNSNQLNIEEEKDFLSFWISRKPSEKNEEYFVVLDHQSNEIRSINKSTVNWLKFNGVKWIRTYSGDFLQDNDNKIKKFV